MRPFKAVTLLILPALLIALSLIPLYKTGKTGEELEKDWNNLHLLNNLQMTASLGVSDPEQYTKMSEEIDYRRQVISTLRRAIDNHGTGHDRAIVWGVFGAIWLFVGIIAYRSTGKRDGKPTRPEEPPPAAPAEENGTSQKEGEE